jgi:glycosyltransferase involved in cell wall biosynthesis
MLPDKTGLVVSGNDSIALAEALDRLLSRPRERITMGRKARRYTEARSFDAAFLETWETYQTVRPSEGHLRWVAGF